MPTPEEMQRREEVSRVKATAEQDLLNLPNVTGVFTGRKVKGGVDTGQVAIVVTVSEKKDVPAKQAVPKEINGVPTDVIEEKIEPMLVVSAVRLEDIAPMVDTATYATLEGGISLGPCRSFYLEPPEVETAGNYVFTGTLGCIVKDNKSSDMMMLSNFHVMCVDDTWATGDTMAQPSRVDTGSCPGDVVGSLKRAVLNTGVDCAVATISGRPYSCEIVDIGDVKGTDTATVDMAVRKRGRTTELTHGTVAATDYTTSVDYGDGLGVVTLTNQIRIVNDAPQSAFFGKKGDSGSVVVDEDNNIVGLYFAGNTTGTVGVANPIAGVLSALDISICTKGLKKFEKEITKEWIREKDWKSEIKERGKEYFKDWKEYAFEKFGAWENYDPWERIPWVVNPPQIPEFRPPVGGITTPRGMVGPATSSAVEERLARIEAALTGRAAGMGAMWDAKVERGCVDFSQLPPGPGPNPVPAPPFFLTVLDYMGMPLPSTDVVSWGAFSGLNAGWTTEIKIDGKCPVVQATLVHFARASTMEAYNADGTLAGTATMTPTQMVAQTLTIQGSAIVFVRIHCPSDETILLSFCCCEDTPCKGHDEEKPYLVDNKGIVKEPIKELKEPLKEFKEGKEPKEFKEQIKEIKEPKEFKEIREGGPIFQSPGGRMSVEERLANLEAMLGGGGQHFIPPGMRPDLGSGALRNEPDVRGRLRRRG
jgi:Peptidase S7, Flavivirus NS3 serine protease